MNSRDLIFVSLERREPDRVPMLEWSIDPKVRNAIYPGCSYFDFLEKIGMDGVTLGYEHTLSGHDGDIQPGYKFKDKWGNTFPGFRIVISPFFSSHILAATRQAKQAGEQQN